MASFDQEHAERVDGGGFADARRAGDADARRLAGIGQKRLDQVARRRLMVATPAFDQRDRARQRRAAAGAELFLEDIDVDAGVTLQVHGLVYNSVAPQARGARLSYQRDRLCYSAASL